MTKPKLPWLTFHEAICRARALLPVETSAYDTVLTAIKTARVKVRCSLENLTDTTNSTRVALQLARHQGIKKRHREFDKVPIAKRKITGFVDISKNYPLNFIGDHGDWITESDDFIVAEDPKDASFLIIISDIEIRERDLLSFIENRSFWQTLAFDGRPRAELAWLHFCAALLVLERKNLLNSSSISSPPKLSDKICELTDGRPEARAIRRDVRTLFDLFVGPQRLTTDGILDLEKRGEQFDLLAAVREAIARTSSPRG